MFKKTIILLFVLFMCSCSLFKTPEAYWEEDRQTDPKWVASYYFGYFLAIQHEDVYQLVHPDLHDQIDLWFATYEPTTCDLKPMTFGGSTDGGHVQNILCQCTLEMKNIDVGRLDGWEYYVVTDWDSIRYIDCIE